MDIIFKIDSKGCVKTNSILHGTLKFLLTASFKKKKSYSKNILMVSWYCLGKFKCQLYLGNFSELSRSLNLVSGFSYYLISCY
jgi:hypothetical protein